MRVLITGAGGFLGRHLAQLCARSGDDVTGTYRTVRPQIEGVNLIQMDLVHHSAVGKLVGDLRPEGVFHLAGQSSTTRSWEEPVQTYRDNVLAQVALLDACARQGSGARILIASSSDVYGWVDDSENPVDESRPLAPASPYAGSKVAQEIVGRQYSRVSELEIITVRPFLQIGPGRSDEFFSGAFARQVVEIESGLRRGPVVAGNVDLVRDMSDVRDVAAACRLLMGKGEPGATYNIASGSGRPLRDLLVTMLEIAGIEAEIERASEPDRRVDPPVFVGDARRLREATGWQPAYTMVKSAADMLDDWRTRVGVAAAL